MTLWDAFQLKINKLLVISHIPAVSCVLLLQGFIYLHVCLFTYASVGGGSESLPVFKETHLISIAEQIDNLSDSDSWLNRRRFTDIKGFALTFNDCIFLCNLTNATRAI